VTRKVDSSGNVCFAGANYRVGNAYRRRQVQVAVVGDTVEISIGEQLIRSHKIKHDRTREHGALANPSAARTASTPPDRFDLSASYRGQTVRRVPRLDSKHGGSTGQNPKVRCSHRRTLGGTWTTGDLTRQSRPLRSALPSLGPAYVARCSPST
jgi:hypothetical protein